MPLLKRQPFRKQKPPEDVELDEEFFYCKVTREVFRDYEEFFERVILCNSLVWTCELTGRPGLTYVEAIESEEKARKLLLTLPNALKRSLLFLATLTRRGRLADMCDDVLSFVRERYFIGEEVEVTRDGEREIGIVRKVYPPSDVPDLETSENHVVAVNAGSPSEKKTYGPNPSSYRYDVQINEELVNSEASSIIRKKGLINRDKIKLFLKQYFEPKDNIWKLKEEVEEKYNISSIKYVNIFAGSLPTFVTTISKKNSLSKPETAPTSQLKDKKEKKTALPQAKEITIEDVEELRRNLEENKKQREEQKLRLKLEKEKERERIREEKRKQAEFLKEWHRPREDFECDDLKDIPAPIPINCTIPNELFGKAVMILEFVNAFGHMFGLKDVFSQGFTLEHLERSILDHDIQSPLGDILQFLLSAIFNLQAGEETVMPSSLINKSETIDINDDDTDLNLAQLLKTASAVTVWPQRHQGLPLKKLALDAYTVTEITRLHLFTLGGQAADPLWHQQVKSSDSIWDDPAVELCLNDPVLLKNLATKSVFELSPAEKLKILEVLINQLLTFLAVREEIEENSEKLRAARCEMRHLQWAEQRREKEVASARKLKTLNGAKSNHVQNGVIDSTNDEDTTNAEESVDKHVNKFDVNCQRKRDSYVKKEQELYETIATLQYGACLQPLGRDRSFRRFWIFKSVPGLFVEDDDIYAENLRQPARICNGNHQATLLHSNENDIDIENISEKLTNDKENKAFDLPLPNHANACNKQHKLLSDNHPVITSGKKMNYITIDEQTLSPEKSAMCALNSTCNVKNVGNYLDAHVNWAFYHTSSALDELINSLNPRGFREGVLRETLIHDRQYITKDLSNCPVHRLNPDVLNKMEIQETRKSSRLVSSLTTVASDLKDAEDSMETTLREMIIDIEERLYAGSLGSVKVTDRLKWRDAIQNKGYEKLCDELLWGKQLEKKVNHELENERCTPQSLAESDSQRSSSPLTVNQNVKDLASALLQVAQGIESKYLKRPLGEDDDERKQRLKILEELNEKFRKNLEENVQDSEADKRLFQKHSKANCVLQRWEESLMMCSSISQVFLHLSTLEVSIAWSKSALNARCRICRRRGDAEKMLLCDECNRGHHTYCLRPSLKTIPEGDWYCKDCKPREQLRPVKAVVEVKKLESIHKDNEEIQDSDSICDDVEDDDQEEEVVESEENNDATETEYEQSSEDEHSQSGNDADESCDEDHGYVNDDLCDACERGGHLICCDSCPLSFHLECTQPPLKRVPRGKWECHNCSADTKVKRKRTSNEEFCESPAKRTRSHLKPSAEEEDEIWMSGRRRQGPPNRRGASRDVPVDYKLCDQILMALSRHDCSWPFTRPVKEKEAPHYYEIIKRPADLATMRKKLSNMEYRTTKEFLADVLLVTQNCIMYNAVDSAEFIAALGLINYFEGLIHELGYFEFDELLFQYKTCSESSMSSSSSPVGKKCYSIV